MKSGERTPVLEHKGLILKLVEIYSPFSKSLATQVFTIPPWKKNSHFLSEDNERVLYNIILYLYVPNTERTSITAQNFN